MDTIHAIKERRSINFFDPAKTLSDSAIDELLRLANLAPSSFNLQPWRVVVVSQAESKKTLRRCAMNQQKVEEASVVLIMAADPDGVEENMDRVLESWLALGFMKPEMRKTYSDMMLSLYGARDSLTRKLFAVKNTALFAMNLMLAAKGLGLDTHPMDGFDEGCVKKEFNIPERMIIPMLVAIGSLKPGVNLAPRAFRRELAEFVSHETYGK
ncbi:MAG TPA: nitroreductase family protein [Deltaproteobacteria bacterium]|nr:nitroreductase family protein [Deltaproteobacteria bacterium]HCY12012.1 nitroreductase family protein [Deltaproteobacteria bacterium]